MSLRSRGGTAAHEAWALAAASRACMPSAGEASATWARTRPVEGSSTGKVAPVSAGRQAPPMNSPLGTELDDLLFPREFVKHVWPPGVDSCMVYVCC